MKMTVEVTQNVEVEFPDNFLTPEFMKQFRDSFYNFNSRAQHFEHVAQLHARGLVGEDSFIEGYGDAKALGIKMQIVGQDTLAFEVEQPNV